MNKLITAVLLICCGPACIAQYYYKDIVVTEQIQGNYQALRDNKVKKVTVMPSNIAPGEKPVTLEQTIYPSQNLVVTYTKVPDAPESWLKAYYDNSGLLVKTVDSSEDAVNTSRYSYTDGRKLKSILSTAVPVNDPTETEEHVWSYNSNGAPASMLKVKNGTDTTIVNYVPDENGNAGEERATRRNGLLGVYYYYYDTERRLTDVARYNARAKRILPDYMFEYSSGKLPVQMTVVPEGSTDYQVWKYVYDSKGLRQKDVCYNKQKMMVAEIEYEYSY